MIRIKILALYMLGMTTLANAQQAPAPKQTETISIQGATIHVGNGTVLERGTLVLKEGIIEKIGPEAEIQAEGTVVDASGKHVYPGRVRTHPIRQYLAGGWRGDEQFPGQCCQRNGL